MNGTLAVVKVHIALTLLGYTLLTMFKELVATWLDQIDYATMELRRFARLFLRAPIAWLTSSVRSRMTRCRKRNTT